MLKRIRIIMALIFFIGITMLFLDFTGTLHPWLKWMPMVQFVPAMLALHVGIVAILMLLTLVFGRIYCSVVCPLGVFQDIVAHIGKRGKRRPYGYSKGKKLLRHAMLAVFVIAIAGGIGSLVALLSPYSAYGRMAANIFQPVYLLGNNILAYIAERMDSYAFYSAEIWMRSLPTFVIAVATFVIVSVLAWRNGRTYCNTICPVGTLLGFLSRFSWFKVYIDHDKCRHCGKCAHHCKAACLDSKGSKIDYDRCVVCGDCLGECEFGALKYGHQTSQKGVPAQPKSTKDNVDRSKRGFLLSSVLAATAAAMAQKEQKVDGGLAKIEDKVAPKRTTPITPAGSLSAQNMAHKCTGCQLCVAACPNGVLRPSTDLMKLMQPTMSYERGYCRPECTRCSEVCPTGAIHDIDKAMKSSTQIGHAVWVKKNCLPVADGVSCGNCARHCPTGAITMVPFSTPNGEVQIPAVDESRCIGCGACEHLCPARPFSAIYVEGHEVHKTI